VIHHRKRGSLLARRGVGPFECTATPRRRRELDHACLVQGLDVKAGTTRRKACISYEFDR
jgi:hypothetical protein